jgi:hypothetical protein
MLFAYRCKIDGATDGVFRIGQAPKTIPCPKCGESIPRSYSDENKAYTGPRAVDERVVDPTLFLPTKDDFARQAAQQGDPNPQRTGEKKMNEWMENHRPAEGNSRPLDPRKL